MRPGAFLGFIKAIVILYALAAPILAFYPWVSAALATLATLILVLEFFLYKEAIDPFFPAVEGRNVVGVLEPRGAAKRQVLVSGHHDSAHIFNFYVDRPELFARRINCGIGTVLLFFASSLPLALFAPPLVLAVAAAAFVLGLFFVAPLWNFASKEGTPGAGDNLAASAAALEIARGFRARRDRGEGLESPRASCSSASTPRRPGSGARGISREGEKANSKPCRPSLTTWIASIRKKSSAS